MTFKGYKVRNISPFLSYPNGVKLHVYQDIIMATEQMLYLTNGHNFLREKVTGLPFLPKGLSSTLSWKWFCVTLGLSILLVKQQWSILSSFLQGIGRHQWRSFVKGERYGWAWRPTLTVAQLHSVQCTFPRDNSIFPILHNIEIDQDRNYRFDFVHSY